MKTNLKIMHHKLSFLNQYFIIKGKEKVVLSQEKKINNILYINSQNDPIIPMEAAIKSISKEGFQSSRRNSISLNRVIVGYEPSNTETALTNRKHVFRLTVRILGIEMKIPLFVLFRCLGFENDKKILSTIIYDTDSDGLRNKLLDLLTAPSQKSIYLSVLDDLKSVSDALAENQEPIVGDIIFKGNKLQWRKLINAYYLRVLMSLSNKTGDSDLNIRSRFQEIINNPAQYPLMTSNSDNGALNYFNIQDNRYPYFNDNDLQTAYYMEQNFVDKLKDFEDPRLFRFAEPKPTAADDDMNDFESYGGLKGSEDLNINTSKAVSGEASRIAERYFFDPVNEPSILMSYWEQEFIIAEAAVRSWIAVDPETHYRNGVAASFDFFKTPMPEDYFDNDRIDLDAGNEIQKILEQKYISMFMNTGWQIFFEQRRTGFPEFNTDGAGILNNGRIPKRWMYPMDEATNNSANLQDAISRQFSQGDNINAEMWILQ